VAACERDPYAAERFLDRTISTGLGDPAVWCGDLAEFPAECWAGRVDLITAGFPCQPFSGAGKQLGSEDERYIWPAIARIIRVVGPRFVLLENVRALLTYSREFGQVLGDLADCGFDAEWTMHSAAAVGAPHRRERIFVLAWRVSDAERDVIRKQPERGNGAARATDAGNAELGDVGNRNGSRRSKARGGHSFKEGAKLEQGSGNVAHGDKPRWKWRRELGTQDAEPETETDQRQDTSGCCGVDIPAFPPGPGDRDAWAAVLAERPDLAPALANPTRRNGAELSRSDQRELQGRDGARDGVMSDAESRQERNAGVELAPRRTGEGDSTQSSVRVLADEFPSWMDRALSARSDQLRCLGNGVHPLTAATAILELQERAGISLI